MVDIGDGKLLDEAREKSSGDFREYPRLFESYYDSPIRKRVERNKWRFPGYMDDSGHQKFLELFRKSVAETEENIFDMAIKIAWIRRNILFTAVRGEGHGPVPPSSSIERNVAVMLMMEREIGVKLGAYVESFWLKVIGKYMDDFFPDIDKIDPLAEKFRNPYEHMNIGCLGLVHQIRERKELLDIGERGKMLYGEFVDYVINWIMSDNLCRPEDRYGIKNRSGILFVTRAGFFRQNR